MECKTIPPKIDQVQTQVSKIGRMKTSILKKPGAFDSAKNHKRQRRKRQSVTAKRE